MIQLEAPSQIILSDEVVQLNRFDGYTYVDGKAVASKYFNLRLRCNVQPLDGTDLMIVPEGDRFKEQYWIYSADPVLINDEIVRENKTYQIQTIQNWGSVYRSRIMRVDGS